MRYTSWTDRISSAVGTRAVMLRSRRRAFRCCLLLSGFYLLSGCATYHFGNRSLFPSDIQTVYVPMVQSASFRPGLGEVLTEAICKEIEDTTPFKVVSSPNADSVLTAKIIADTKRVIVENKFDEQRSTDVNYQVQVNWTNRRGDMIRNGPLPLPPQFVVLGQSAVYIPEYGQSYTTAEQQLVQRMAEQIVGMMEVPW
ncbi:MAG: hypothetical protein IT427_04725 [Pirellulales bacterium]|nr:hypothetical protein [Pirellulales bacterium]